MTIVEEVMADVRAALAADPTACRVAGRRGRWHRSDKRSGTGVFDCGVAHHAALLCTRLSLTLEHRRCRRCFPPAPAVEV